MELPGGFKARSATPDDIDAIAALTAAIDLSQGSEPTYRRDEILIDWNRPGFELDADSWLIQAPDGTAAFGHLAPRGNSDLVFMMWIHPDYERHHELASALIAGMEERARVIAAESSQERGVAIASEQEKTLMAAIEGAGFEPDALFVEMVMDLGPEHTAVDGPEGIVISTFQPDEAEAFYEVLVESFSEHWGAGFPPFDEWLRDVTALDGYDPYLSITARDGDDMIGVLFGNMHEGLGEVHDIGVLTSHRGRGIGEALMRDSFRRFRERGGDRARLWVDTANVTDAIKLYEKVGMTVARRMHFYAKPLP